MAGQITLSSSLGGSVTLTAADSANSNYISLPAANAIAVYSVANTGYLANTGATVIASGNTAQRPANTVNGMLRYNSTVLSIEFWNGTGWVTTGGYSITYLAVGGGGGGNGYGSGGGGAGGFLTGTSFVTPGKTYNVIVGAGGAQSTGQSSSTNGYPTIIDTMADALGGGAGGSASAVGQSGGSGGGGGAGYAGGAGTSGQGYAGGSNKGGGGGASAVGGSTSGAGGAGANSSITGTTVAYAGGGGGSGGGAGGLGGGGTGGVTSGGTAGTVNTGGGGGAGGSCTPGLAGGSGIAILSIPTLYFSNNYTVGTANVSGNNTIITFKSSGTYTA
jgi:hypothetical protein